MRWLVLGLMACAASPPPRVLRNHVTERQVDVPITDGSWKLFGHARLSPSAIQLELCTGGVSSAQSHIEVPPGLWQLRAVHTNTDCMTGTELRARHGDQLLAWVVLSSANGAAEAKLVLAQRTDVEIDIGAFGDASCCGTTVVRAITFAQL